MKLILLLLPLLTLAACDSARDGDVGYDLTFYSEADAVLARIQFDISVGDCEGSDCGGGYAEWRARDVAPEFPIQRTSGRLHVQPDDTGGHRLTLNPYISDDDLSAEILDSGDGQITGTWTHDTLLGEVARGRVEGRAE